MSYSNACRTGFILALTVGGLSACSSFVQQPAPVESPTQSAGSVYPAQRSAPVETAGSSADAQTEPYRAGAPVANGNTVAASPSRPVSVSPDDGKTHVVAPGENLFRISLSHGLKYQQVASWNNLPDYNIQVGQVLRLTPPGSGNAAAPAVAATVAPPVAGGGVKTYPKAVKLPYSESARRSIAAQSEGTDKTAQPGAMQASKADSSGTTPHVTSSAASAVASAPAAAGEDGIVWAWPVRGKVLRGYSDANKGVDIGGRMGQPVLAAGDGKVVYSGSGLRGYGKLIIIKHNKTFLSAYAHNSKLLVKEGQTVKQGQKIAEMGNSDADQVKLHFEIRRFGKPVDPMQYLNSKT
jgi:lipoprotein NlpD